MSARLVRLRLPLGVDSKRLRLKLQGRRCLRTSPSSRYTRPGQQLISAPRLATSARSQAYSNSAPSRQLADAATEVGETPPRPGGHGDDGDAGGRGDCFPWRRAPEDYSMENLGIFGRIFYAVSQNHLKTVIRNSIADEGFHVGIEMAFVSMAAALFKMRMLDVRDTRSGAVTRWQEGESGPLTPPVAAAAWSAEAATAAIGDHQQKDESSTQEQQQPESLEHDQSPRLDAIADSRLVDFVERAGEATRARNAIPFYRLHKVLDTSEPDNVLMLVGTNRERFDRREMVASHTFPGWVIFFDERFTDAPSMAQSVEHLSSREYLTQNVLQIDVHLMCLETFFVRDRETNEIIQGSEKPEIRLHRLRLEASPGLVADPLEIRWKVIDLDNWLEGNTFW
ncbi:unnamed protein product [Sphacelaria rigidula]